MAASAGTKVNTLDEKAARVDPVRVEHVLCLGEGNFSYARALLLNNNGPGSVLVTATSLDSAADVATRHGGSAKANIAALVAGGSRVLHGIDATTDLTKAILPQTRAETPATADLSGSSDSSTMKLPPISCIVFRHPHTGLKSVPSNRKLLVESMQRVAEMLASSAHCAPCARFEITVKTTGRYNEWAGDLRLPAAATNPPMVLVHVARPKKVPTYQHATTTGRDEGVRNDVAASWTFVLAQCVAGGDHVQNAGSRHGQLAALEVLPQWLQRELTERCCKCSLCNKIFTTPGDLEKHCRGRQHAKRVKEHKRRARAEQRNEKRRREVDTSHKGGDSFRCEACTMVLNSKASWLMHINGKRHKAAVSRRQQGAAISKDGAQKKRSRQ
eukprot:INCI2086.1.p1 GENE.INCI2086.1~~INCI2086.1.p1  ORF type:complete len:386 (-),score=61.12 INCI2086.1:265-1422(-)